MSRHAIGEVLNRLTGEFEDITISKIRYLEAEGLITPDRSDSGYRQFSDAEIERLRYVLRAQRDRYLPLKVIREELERIDAGLPAVAAGPAQDALPGTVPATPPGAPVPQLAEGAPEPARPPRPPRLPADDVRVSGRQLADMLELDEALLRSLQEHGLLPKGDSFDGDAVEAARAARGLLVAGLEPRHLRMYRQFSDREVALLGQLVQPMLRQRNPEARARARDLLDDLADHGTALHAALLRRELRDLLGE